MWFIPAQQMQRDSLSETAMALMKKFMKYDCDIQKDKGDESSEIVFNHDH